MLNNFNGSTQLRDIPVVHSNLKIKIIDAEQLKKKIGFPDLVGKQMKYFQFYDSMSVGMLTAVEAYREIIFLLECT